MRTPNTTFTIIDNGRVTDVAATIASETVWLSPEAVAAALGPVAAACGGAEIDLAELARRLDRPLALDVPERLACCGGSAEERGRALATLEAPDFELPGLDGRLHRLAEHRGRKVLLVAHASW